MELGIGEIGLSAPEDWRKRGGRHGKLVSDPGERHRWKRKVGQARGEKRGKAIIKGDETERKRRKNFVTKGKTDGKKELEKRE